MGSSLFNTTPQNTYPSLIKLGDNLPLSGTLKRLSDGNGNDLPLLVSTSAITNYGGGAITSNTAFGATALDSNTTGSNNTAFGLNALTANSTGTTNTAIGALSLENTTASNNTGIGYRSLRANTSGTQNVGVAVDALLDNTTGIGNTAVGYSTGLGITTGNYNTILGANVTGLSSSLSNNIILADGQGNRRINVDSSGNVGIGTSTPLALLHISQSGANTICRIGNNSAYDQFIYFNGGNDFSLGMDASNSNAFVLSNASTLGTNDRLVVTTTGNVGIGTSTPPFKLSVSASDTSNSYPTNASIHVVNSEASNFGRTMGMNFAVGAGSSSEIISGVYGVYTGYTTSTGGALSFVTNDGSSSLAERMRITSAGNVGIGTSAPLNRLHVFEGVSSAPNYNATLHVENSGSSNAFFVFQTATSVGNAFSVTNAGNVGIGTTAPTTKLTVDGTGVTNQIDIVGSNSAAKGHLGYFSDGVYLSSNYYFNGSQNNDNAGLGQALVVLQASSGSASKISFNTSAAGSTSTTTRASIDADGLKFNGDTAAANALDDYEEGTFTATITGGTFSSLNTGVYTKIGRQVYWYLSPTLTAITGNLTISSLPFTNANRSASVFATVPPAGVTYLPAFHNSSSASCDVNVSGTYSGVAISTYFAGVYSV